MNIEIPITLSQKTGWQESLDALLVEQDIELIRSDIESLILSEIQSRNSLIELDPYQIRLLLDSMNEYIHKKNKAWAKNELKLKKSGRGKNFKMSLIYHDYTYQYNVFKKEVDFYDNGNKIFTYRSEWVKANIGDEHSICVYALNYIKKSKQDLFQKGFEIRKED